MSEVNPKSLKEAEGALFLADGDTPWLLNIFSSIADSPTALEHGFLAVLYIIMYEAGFYFLDGPHNSTLSYDVRTMRCLKDPNILLKHLKMENKQYVTHFSHELMYPNILTVVTYSIITSHFYKNHMLVVNFFCPNNKNLQTISINPDNLISFEPNKGPLIADERVHFISYVKNILCSFKGTSGTEVYHHPHHILSLPLHVLQLICRNLGGKSFIKFVMSCKFLYEIFSEDETLWKKFSLNEYRCLNKSPNETWKNHYVYQAKKIQRLKDFRLPPFILHPYGFWY
ncbi:unnamed protein product [Nezara viridula]|uniref:F-box domain-containing protein n=1 Tax=Nezara viridula TaxID=85310 RepID=A0A9P0MSE7_NEZVI|nr:unnamed protein product [Nezara viridula]